MTRLSDEITKIKRRRAQTSIRMDKMENVQQVPAEVAKHRPRSDECGRGVKDADSISISIQHQYPDWRQDR